MTQGSWCLEQWEEECYQWDSVFVGDPPPPPQPHEPCHHDNQVNADLQTGSS